MRDSYQRFFSKGYISKEQFFEFGLKETIYISADKAEREWELLKKKIYGNEKVFIRGFGRDANGTHLFQELYKHLFGNDKVTKDSTNNAEPTKIIRELTGYSKLRSARHEPIRNYQISHIFGRTKNVFAFTAPWNIVYMPKMLDPFTGHEAQGDLIDEYTDLFQRQSYQRFGRIIDDFNQLVSNAEFLDRLKTSFNTMTSNGLFAGQDMEKLRKSVSEEFSPIVIGS